MKYLLEFICPLDENLISKLIDAAASAGAGKEGNYSRCAFIQTGTGTWRTEPGAHPHIGKVGEISTEPMVQITMECEGGSAQAVFNAIKAAHPFEEPTIRFIPVIDIWGQEK